MDVAFNKKTGEFVNKKPTKKKKEVFVKGIGRVEEEVKSILILEDGTAVDQGEEVKELKKKQVAEDIFAERLLSQLDIKDKSYEKWESLKDSYLQGKVSYDTWRGYWKIDKQSKELLIEAANEQALEDVNIGDVNWLEKSEDYFKSWARVKMKNTSMLKDGGELFQLFGCTDEITGKPQIRDNVRKTSITLLVKCVKKDEEGVEQEKYKFVDDYYNKRDDGYETDVLEKTFWVYDVVDNGESYLIFCNKKIENQEVHTFHGMKIKVPHKKEFDKNLSCRGSANLFFCKESESTIKPIDQDKIIPYVEEFVKDYSIGKKEYSSLMMDYIFINDNGNIYRQPDDYMRMRHSHLLSGKEDGYPNNLCIWSSPGLGKTCEAECTDRIFQESIMEAGNSTPKALIQSFKEKPANPGFILSSNRIAIIDELMKMIDNQIGNSRGLNDVKNQLGQLNMILEHKKRTVGSGNDNTLTSQSTAKPLIFTNPSMKSSFLHEELSVLDASTLTRLLPWVKDVEHEKFIEENKLLKCADTHPICYTKIDRENEKVLYKGKVFAHRLRDFYVTIYDSCQNFSCKVDISKVDTIFKTLVQISKNPMKTIWKRRGLHHTKLMLDGIVKFRCIFEDFDTKFEAIDKDYDDLERIMVRMVKSWDTNMSIKEDY